MFHFFVKNHQTPLSPQTAATQKQIQEAFEANQLSLEERIRLLEIALNELQVSRLKKVSSVPSTQRPRNAKSRKTNQGGGWGIF